MPFTFTHPHPLSFFFLLTFLIHDMLPTCFKHHRYQPHKHAYYYLIWFIICTINACSPACTICNPHRLQKDICNYYEDWLLRAMAVFRNTTLLAEKFSQPVSSVSGMSIPDPRGHETEQAIGRVGNVRHSGAHPELISLGVDCACRSEVTAKSYVSCSHRLSSGTFCSWVVMPNQTVREYELEWIWHFLYAYAYTRAKLCHH